MRNDAEAKILRQELARYRRLLAANTDERVKSVLQRLIREIEGRLKAAGPALE